MKIKVKYFGIIAENAGRTDDVLEIDDSTTLQMLKKQQSERYNWSNIESIKVAVNQKITQTGSIRQGDEIAFLPPFAGG